MLNDLFVKLLNNSAYGAVRVSYRGGKMMTNESRSEFGRRRLTACLKYRTLAFASRLENQEKISLTYSMEQSPS
jgi:hypothetical protein